MGDDICKPHHHYSRDHSCIRHHYYPRDGMMRCPGCGREVQSVVNRDVARKWQDRYDWR